MKNENWESGEWDNEPDSLDWIDDYSGYECKIKRNKLAGFLSGYVSIPENNRFYGINYDDHEGCEFMVHEGVNFSGFCKDGKYRLGFSCDMCFDVLPLKSEMPELEGDETYKNIAYVKEQTELLAKQVYELQYRNYLKPCR